MRNPKSSPWWRDSNQTASGKPGAVHTVVSRPLLGYFQANEAASDQIPENRDKGAGQN